MSCVSNMCTYIWKVYLQHILLVLHSFEFILINDIIIAGAFQQPFFVGLCSKMQVQLTWKRTNSKKISSQRIFLGWIIIIIKEMVEI